MELEFIDRLCIKSSSLVVNLKWTERTQSDKQKNDWNDSNEQAPLPPFQKCYNLSNVLPKTIHKLYYIWKFLLAIKTRYQ